MAVSPNKAAGPRRLKKIDQGGAMASRTKAGFPGGAGTDMNGMGGAGMGGGPGI